jgi:predicted lipase
VFGTGPSLDDVFDIEIPSGSLSIICNSIVKDKELLDHLQPDVLVFADPVFHFGPSRYADKFRKDVVHTLQEYDCTAVIPKKYHSLFTGNYPELSEQIIGLESISTDEFVLPTHERLEVRGTSNIMTLFMLPIAVSLTEEVRIIGADGRKEDESYFWEHSDTGQYDDELMDTVAETHPAFFRDRIYEDYYEKHVETLTDLIEYSESQGVKINSVTNSYIPCLSERRTGPKELTSTESDLSRSS